MVFEVLIEGKHSFNVCLINERKTGAVSKTQPSVLKSLKDSSRRFFNILSDTENGDIAFLHLVHEFYSG